jgi:hypothetical protein
MKDLKQCKRCEVLIDKSWIQCHWEQLEVGDVIRMSSPQGNPIMREFDVTSEMTPMLVAEHPYVLMKKIPKVPE